MTILTDKDIAVILNRSLSDIIYHFKKGHIKGVHLDNVGWFASRVEANKFIRNYLKGNQEKALKKQKTIFDYKEK